MFFIFKAKLFRKFDTLFILVGYEAWRGSVDSLFDNDEMVASTETFFRDSVALASIVCQRSEC